MTLSRGILIHTGVALVLVAMIYGLIYAVFVEHQKLDAMGGALADSFVATAERDRAKGDASMRRYADSNDAYVRQVDVHSHWSGLGLLLILLGLAFDNVGYSERVRRWLATVLAIGSSIFPLGVLAETTGLPTGGQWLAAAGAALVTLALAAVVYGFAHAPIVRNS
jgi:hypothetical protein